MTPPRQTQVRKRHLCATAWKAAESRCLRFLTRFVPSIAIAGLLLLTGCGMSVQTQSPTPSPGGDFLERVTEKGPVKLVIRVAPKEPRLSDLVEMDVQVVALSGVEIKPPTFGQAVGDFLVRDYGERTDRPIVQRQSTGHVADKSTRHFRYQLEPVHAGRHLIRSLSIEFIDNRLNSEQHGEPALIESEPMEIHVTSELGDQIPNLEQLEPMLPPRPLSQSIRWRWLLGSGLFAVLAGMVVWMRRSRKSFSAEPTHLTAEEIAHAAFAALLSEDLPAKGLFKEFYLRLTGIVRRFIEGTTGLRAPDQTTEEFLSAMQSRVVFSVERSNRLKQFLEAADMVKYAGQDPDHEQIELSIARAREFVAFQLPDVTSSVEPQPTKEV